MSEADQLTVNRAIYYQESGRGFMIKNESIHRSQAISIYQRYGKTVTHLIKDLGEREHYSLKLVISYGSEQ